MSASCQEYRLTKNTQQPHAESLLEPQVMPDLLHGQNLVHMGLPDNIDPLVEEIKGEEDAALVFPRPDSGHNSPRHALQAIIAPENLPEQAVVVQQEDDVDVFSENSYDSSDLNDPIVNQVLISEVQIASA